MKPFFIKNPLIRYSLFGFIFVSILGTLCHFLYDWSGQNPIVGLFCAVNESTWEHMKLLFFPMLVYYAFTYKKLETTYPLITSTSLLSILIGTWLIPILFYSYSGILGFHLAFFDILTFYVSVFVAFLYFYLLTRDYKISNDTKTYPVKHPKRNAWLIKQKNLFLFLVLLLLFSFILFTYRPPKLGIFQAP